MTHLLYHPSVKVGVQTSVVSQHRIGNYQTIRPAKVSDKLRNNLNLSRRTQVSSIDSIELYPLFLPLGNNLGHFVRQVEEGEIGILRMIGQDGCRQRTNLKTHRRKNRNDNSQRHAPHPRKVMNGCYFLYFIGIHIYL